MMLLLPGDVTANTFDLRKTDGEDPVTTLPPELHEVGRFCFQPKRGTAFDLLDQFGHLASAR